MEARRIQRFTRHASVRRWMSRLVYGGWRMVQTYGAIGPGTDAAERFGSFGAGTMVGFPPSTLSGESGIHLGRETLVASWATLSAGYPTRTPPERALVIGDRCWIGMRTSIVAHESIEIGDDVWFGPDVYVTDANHGMDDLDVPVGRQLGTNLPVRIGSGSWIGRGAIVLPGVQIGRNTVVAAGSVVRHEVPDFGVVAGVPAKLLRLRGA